MKIFHDCLRRGPPPPPAPNMTALHSLHTSQSMSSSSSTPSSWCCGMRLRMKAVLLARVSNHSAITMKVRGTMRVARIHHQYVMANSRPSGLKNTALKKDYRDERGVREQGPSRFLFLSPGSTYQCERRYRAGVALELHGDLDRKIAEPPVELGEGPAAPQRDGLAEAVCLWSHSIRYFQMPTQRPLEKIRLPTKPHPSPPPTKSPPGPQQRVDDSPISSCGLSCARGTC